MPIRACNSPPLRQDIASPCANVSNAGGLYSAGTVRLPSALNKNAPVASTHAHKNLPAGGHRLIQHVVCVRAEIYGLAQLVFKNRSCGGSHLYLRHTVAAASRPEAAPGVTSFCMASFGKKLVSGRTYFGWRTVIPPFVSLWPFDCERQVRASLLWPNGISIQRAIQGAFFARHISIYF